MGLWMKAIVGCTLAWLILRFTSEDPFKPEEMVYGKNMIITGASSGIGKETAILACEMGANVFITARRENLLKEVIGKCNEVGRKGAKHGYLAADMVNTEQAKSVILKGTELLGGIDFLILNHGQEASPTGLFHYTDENLQNFKKLFDINFFSMVQMTITAMPFLKKSKGKVATVTSVLGEMPWFMGSPYAATKSSMGVFFTTLEHENYVKMTNVSFTLFVAGAVETPMIKRFLKQVEVEEGINYENTWLSGMVQGLPARDCAHALIRATALRETKTYFPDARLNKWMVYFAKIFPETFKSFINFIFS